MKKNFLLILMCLFIASCAKESPVFKDDNHMPVQTEQRFIGQDKTDIRKTLGQPFVVRKEEPNELWTYRQDGCITLLYFDKANDVCHAERRGDCPRVTAHNKGMEK